ncbi:hypothetical protein HDV00_006472 [Rhizophlyctis rosea]|nr:hypothetical protein HDV00_006472 [Rhizophlyctis rosea]
MSSTESSQRDRTDAFRYDAQGRRLHADLTPLSVDAVSSDKLYVLPNDDEEMDRLHLQHYVMKLQFKSNFSAPVSSLLHTPGAKVLDVGCGSGIWAFEMASDFPKSHITGFDLSPVQPSNVKPKNVEFLTGDLTKLPLPFADNTFDYVHMRLLVLALRTEFWPILIGELVRIVKPGGWLEMTEARDFAMKGPTKVPNLMGILADGCAARGCDIQIALKLKSYMEFQPLLTSVQEVTHGHHSPVHPTDKEGLRIARMYGDDITAALMGLKSQLVAKGICAEGEYGMLVRAHVEETLATDHTVYTTRCFAKKRAAEE